MRCPNCKHDNSNLATRCANCGAILPTNPNPHDPGFEDPTFDNPNPHGMPWRQSVEPTQLDPSTRPGAGTDPRSIDPDDTVPQNTVQRGGTIERPQASGYDAQPTVSTKVKWGGLGRILRTVRRPLHAAGKRTSVFFERNQRLLGLGIAVLVVGALVLVWLGINSTLSAPAYANIESDMAALLPTYEYAGGTYGPDLQLPLSNTTVTNRSATKTPEGMEAGPGVGPAAYGVEAELTYDDGKIRVVRNVAATYVRDNDAWRMSGELTERGTSVFARAGIDENKVMANMGSILDAASSQNDVALSELYANGSFSVVGNVFKETTDRDTATDDVTIHCTQSGTFFGYEGNVTAHFAFESGTWKLRSCEADGRITTRTYTPLVGTWGGGLSTASTPVEGASCYGAQNQPLTVFIESVGDPSGGSGTVKGTITVLAHFHERLAHEAAGDPGDVLLESVDFTGTIDTSYDSKTDSDLNLRCTTSGSPEGLVDFVLSFGTSSDPSTVVAHVTSTHNYQDTIFFFIPHQTTATFMDTYLLGRT
jgi:hypothetical protein